MSEVSRRHVLGMSVGGVAAAGMASGFHLRPATAAPVEDLNARLAAMPAGSTLTVKGGAYDILEWPVMIPPDVGFDGRGAQFFVHDVDDLYQEMKQGLRPVPSWAKNADYFLRNRVAIDGAYGPPGHGARIRNTKIIGTNTASHYTSTKEAQHGLNLHGGNLIENVTVNDVWGDALYVRGRAITARTLHAIGTGRMAIGITNGGEILVNGLTTDRIGRSVIDIEPYPNEAVDGVIIRNGTIGSHGLGFSGGSGGAVIGSGGGGMVRNVLIEDMTSLGPFIINIGTPDVRRSGYSFHRCRGGAAWNHPTITARNMDDLEVSECYQEFHIAKEGMTLYAMQLLDVGGFTSWGNEWPGATGEVQP